MPTEKEHTKDIHHVIQLERYVYGLYDLLHRKLLIDDSAEIQFIPLLEIIFLKANKNYTEIICTNNKKYLSANTLKSQEEKLPNHLFIRANHGYLINVFHLCSIKKKNELSACMSNGQLIPISTRKKKQVLQQISNSSIVLDKALIV